MRIEEEMRKPAPEPMAPMINVVFLLLIFFLMSATLAPSTPIEAEPPASARGAPSDGGAVLVVSSEGEIAFEDARGAAAVAAAAEAARTSQAPVRIRGDAEAPAAALVAIVADLRRAGAPRVELTTTPRGGSERR